MNLLASRAERPSDDASPVSRPADSKRRTRRIAAVSAVALIAAVAAFGASVAFSGGGSSHSSTPAAAAGAKKLAGSFTIFGGGTATDACAGAGATGEVVKVTNAAGTVLTKGTLGPGAPIASGHGCTYRFTAPRPASAHSYLVAVGDRGRLSFTHAQMAAAHWTLDINIGSQQPTG
jgi:hypothetical protein